MSDDAVSGWAGVRYASVREFNRGEMPGWVKVPEDSPAYRIGARWYVRPLMGPSGVGRLSEGAHTVTEHEDGTITVEPSLVMPDGWHGWLRRGVFTVA
jgi:hypothetical protein